MATFDLYAEITNQISSMLEKGVVPWRSPILGRKSAGHPESMTTGKKHRGINIVILAFYSGHDRAEAEARKRKLVQLWELQLGAFHFDFGDGRFWDDRLRRS